MTADEAKKETARVLGIKAQEDDKRKQQAEKDRQWRRDNFRVEWKNYVERRIADAVNMGRYAADAYIDHDVEFKRDHVRKWAELNGYSVQFSQEYFVERDKDNETGQEFGGYWHQKVTINW